MKKRIATLWVFSLALALFALPAWAAGDSTVKGLWIEIPGLPESGSEISAIQPEGEAFFERTMENGALQVSVERLYVEDHQGKPRVPADAGKLSVRQMSVRKDTTIALDAVTVTESVPELAKIYTYPVAAAFYATGEKEDLRNNRDIYIFTDPWIFRAHFSIKTDREADYGATAVKGWFENMKLVERDPAKAAEAVATKDNADKAPVIVAIAYTAPGNEGIPWRIREAGDYDLRRGFGLPNDSISGIAVAPGYKVTIYQHSEFGGESKVIDKDTPDLGDYSRWASSMKVEKTGETDADAVKAWLESHSPDATRRIKIDQDVASVAKALEMHNDELDILRREGASYWYGERKDAERVALAEEMLKIFSDCGVDVDAWTPNTFAQMMNNFYDWRKDLDMLEMACLVLNVDSAFYPQ